MWLIGVFRFILLIILYVLIYIPVWTIGTSWGITKAAWMDSKQEINYLRKEFNCKEVV